MGDWGYGGGKLGQLTRSTQEAATTVSIGLAIRSRRGYAQIAPNVLKRPLQTKQLNLDAYAVARVEVDNNAP